MSDELTTGSQQLQQITNYFEDKGVVDYFIKNTTFTRENVTQRALEFVMKLNQQDFDNQGVEKYKPLCQCSSLSKQQTFMKILSLNLPADYRSFYYLYNRNGTMVFEISYKGMLLLAERSGYECNCELVYEGDDFSLSQTSDGDHYTLVRKSVFSHGVIVGAFVSAEHNGKTKVYVYNFEELETSRKKSKAKDSPAWRDFRVDMYKKSAIRKALNVILSKTDVTLNRNDVNILMEDDIEPEVQSTKTADLDKQTKFEELKNQYGIMIDVEQGTEA